MKTRTDGMSNGKPNWMIGSESNKCLIPYGKPLINKKWGQHHGTTIKTSFPLEECHADGAHKLMSVWRVSITIDYDGRHKIAPHDNESEAESAYYGNDKSDTEAAIYCHDYVFRFAPGGYIYGTVEEIAAQLGQLLMAHMKEDDGRCDRS